jgi:hypothetical protein
MLRSRPKAGVSKHGPHTSSVAHLSAEFTPRDETRPYRPLLRVRHLAGQRASAAWFVISLMLAISLRKPILREQSGQ